MTDQTPIHQNSTLFDPTRSAAEAALQDFKPRMGRAYAAGRNFDHGPGQHSAVSQLSPYLRRRMVLERDVVRAALGAHGHDGAEKFIQEVVWRGYFKGWLERRPQVWGAYKQGLAHDRTTLDRDKALRRDVELAEAGQTRIACFDAWAKELVETGYLHNHARMWFASIWIFTLRLPWRLGADFFFRHLLDGDPASNTCSWRWVAGLHTRGKPYHAQAWNIAKFTDQRFHPDKEDLADVVEGLEHQEPEGLPGVQPLREPRAPNPNVPSALLITEEDLRPEDFSLDQFDICATATLAASELRSDLPTADLVRQFEAAALADTASHQSGPVTPLSTQDPDAMITWATDNGAQQIVTPYVPTGPLRDWLTDAQPQLDAAGLTLCEMRRDWDSLIWPHATAGFFKVKKKIPDLLHKSGLI